jgi:predicted ArsR family transcriptional regulator
MPEPRPLDVHKALADDTRYRLYRFLRLSGRPVSVRELSGRLSLHPNTLRPHLRRLEEAGLVASEVHRGAGGTVGRPQTLFRVVETEPVEGRDYRLLAEILAGLLHGKRNLERAEELAREWGRYLVTQDAPKPGVRLPAGRHLAVLQEAMAGIGFDPRFRRTGAQTVAIAMRDCPFRELLDDHRELGCAVHRGLLQGMLEGLHPPMRLTSFEPLAERSTICRLTARSPRGGGQARG